MEDVEKKGEIMRLIKTQAEKVIEKIDDMFEKGKAEKDDFAILKMRATEMIMKSMEGDVISSE